MTCIVYTVYNILQISTFFVNRTMSDLATLKTEDITAATKMETKTNNGLMYEVVLSPAVKTGPKPSSKSTSPVTAETIEKKLTAAEERRLSMDSLRLQNISAKLARIEMVQQKKEELEVDKISKAKEVLENKFKTVEEKREAQLKVGPGHYQHVKL